jgi:hypothetical protein
MERQSVIRISLAVFIAVVVGLGFLAVPQAFAERGACRDDVAKYCKDVQPGEGRMIKCMKEHEKDLSPGCKANMAEMEKKYHEAREDCKDDVMKFCSDIKPGQGRIIHCLKEHEKELSPQCKSQFSQHQHRKAN